MSGVTLRRTAIASILALGAAGAPLAGASATAEAPHCLGLPRSDMRMVRFETPAPQVVATTERELDRLAAADLSAAAYRAPHPALLLVRAIRSAYSVEHRPVKASRDGGAAYCDAPTSVGIALGFVARRVYVLNEAEADECVRRALLEHEEKHERAEVEALNALINRDPDRIAGRLTELKQAPAPSAADATYRFEAGLIEIVAEAERRFRAERERVRQEVDSDEEIANLHAACGGRLHRIEDGPT